MLTDYIVPEQRHVACPNQDVVYGAGFTAFDISPVVVQVPDFGDRFCVSDRRPAHGRLCADLRSGGSAAGCLLDELAASAGRRRLLAIHARPLAEARGSRWIMDASCSHTSFMNASHYLAPHTLSGRV
jgi:hypothetical protein